MTKFCSMCRRELPLNCFAVDKNNEHKAHCIACVKTPVKTEDQLRDKRERFLKHQVEFDTRKNQNKAPGSSEYKTYLKKMKKEHNMEEEEIRDMMDAQKGCCAACGISLYFPDQVWYPFKDEEFLCVRCSVLVAYSDHHLISLHGVIDYLRRHNG